MTLTELVTSPAYKKFMGYVYGFGASVAIIGALFKILHLPGASIMLIAGLGVEASSLSLLLPLLGVSVAVEADNPEH